MNVVSLVVLGLQLALAAVTACLLALAEREASKARRELQRAERQLEHARQLERYLLARYGRCPDFPPVHVAHLDPAGAVVELLRVADFPDDAGHLSGKPWATAGPPDRATLERCRVALREHLDAAIAARRKPPTWGAAIAVAVALAIAPAALAKARPPLGNPCAGHPPPAGYTVTRVFWDGSAIARRIEQRRHLRFVWVTLRDASTCRWSTPTIVPR